MANNGAASVPLINREDFEETERPASAQRVNPPTNDNLNIGEEEYLEPEEEDSDDPADKLAEFNWDDLHARYHQVINQATDEETELMDEWSHLMGFFKIWAEAGHSHETDRTFSRLRTRMSYTQHSEDKLEKTRNHYIQVVAAFESALTLLKNAGIRS